MLYPVLMWMLQDMAQVLCLGFFVVPDVFFLGMCHRAMGSEQDKDRIPWRIWITFAGGVLWDLRWTSVPGITGAIQAAVLAVMSVFWYNTPSAGRSPGLWVSTAWLGQICVGGVRFLLWGDNSVAAFRLLAIQQLTALPLLIVFWMIVFWKKKYHE